MIAKVVPSLKACFKENEYKWNEADEDGETKFAFLIAVGGQVFEIADDMSVALDSRGFYGVGSGSDYAIGALCAGATLETALTISADNDVYTSAPFIYHTQLKKRLVKK
jgi:ATP-dependent protease HslVU (ClpYQ) peptidase subunit